MTVSDGRREFLVSALRGAIVKRTMTGRWLAAASPSAHNRAMITEWHSEALRTEGLAIDACRSEGITEEQIRSVIDESEDATTNVIEEYRAGLHPGCVWPGD